MSSLNPLSQVIFSLYIVLIVIYAAKVLHDICTYNTNQGYPISGAVISKTGKCNLFIFGRFGTQQDYLATGFMSDLMVLGLIYLGQIH